MLTPAQIDKKFAARALKAEALTPGHSAAEGAVGADDDAEQLRRRVQHEADPYLHEDDLPEVARADLGKRYNEAFDVPSGYPPMRTVDAEQFRRGPITVGEAAYSPAYSQPGRAVPVPTATLAPGMATRPLLTGGRSRACAPGA
jgi:hypothetical protein